MPSVSKRYFNWWKQSTVICEDVAKESNAKSSLQIHGQISILSLSSEDVSHGLVASKCDQITVDGIRNIEVSKSAGAGKNKDDGLIHDEIKITEESHTTLHINSSPMIKKATIILQVDAHKGSENLAPTTLKDANITGESKISCHNSNRAAKEVEKEPFDLENLRCIDDTRKEVECSKVSKVSLGYENREIKTTGVSCDDPIDVDDYVGTSTTTSQAPNLELEERVRKLEKILLGM
ncbi:hypothetical protein GH714_007821 [Hevea brasiliensis]|nr:hypothetical protein GH714_007821 [Hevea brasiliensis]